MSILLIDAQNFFHRARTGFALGDHPVVYNFVRQFRALVEKTKPTRIIFALEGHPKARMQVLPTYKANRAVEVGSAEHTKLCDFFKQIDEILTKIVPLLPVSLIRHPDYEADDTIYNIIKNSSKSTEWTLVTTDSDFVQLLDEFDNVTIYNPISKTNVQRFSVDYVTWKSLRGDPTDNVPGIVTDGVALSLASDPDKLTEFFSNNDNAEAFKKNYSLIKLATWTLEEAANASRFESSKKDWDSLKELFRSYGFKSVTEDKTWSKFVDTFDNLFGE